MQTNSFPYDSVRREVYRANSLDAESALAIENSLTTVDEQVRTYKLVSTRADSKTTPAYKNTEDCQTRKVSTQYCFCNQLIIDIS